jgi:hypothetical protein
VNARNIEKAMTPAAQEKLCKLFGDERPILKTDSPAFGTFINDNPSKGGAGCLLYGCLKTWQGLSS